MTKHLSQILQSFPKKRTFTMKQLNWAAPGERRLADKVYAAHPVQDDGEPFGNEDSFSAKDVKVFNRAANHYGHPNVDFEKVPVDNEHPLRSFNTPVINNEEKKYLRDVVNESRSFSQIGRKGYGFSSYAPRRKAAEDKEAHERQERSERARGNPEYDDGGMGNFRISPSSDRAIGMKNKGWKPTWGPHGTSRKPKK